MSSILPNFDFFFQEKAQIWTFIKTHTLFKMANNFLKIKVKKSQQSLILKPFIKKIIEIRGESKIKSSLEISGKFYIPLMKNRLEDHEGFM